MSTSALLVRPASAIGRLSRSRTREMAAAEPAPPHGPERARCPCIPTLGPGAQPQSGPEAVCGRNARLSHFTTLVHAWARAQHPRTSADAERPVTENSCSNTFLAHMSQVPEVAEKARNKNLISLEIYFVARRIV